MKIFNERIASTTDVKSGSVSREKLLEANIENANANRDRTDFHGDINAYAKEIKSSVKAEYDTKQTASKPSITSEEISAEIQRLKMREKRPAAEEENSSSNTFPEALPKENDSPSEIAGHENPSAEITIFEMLELQSEMLNSLFL